MIHTFKEDLYGEILSVVMVGYIRPERSFDSLGNIYISFSLSETVFTVDYISCHLMTRGHLSVLSTCVLLAFVIGSQVSICMQRKSFIISAGCMKLLCLEDDMIQLQDSLNTPECISMNGSPNTFRTH